jgi:hypothetical protein
MDSLTAASVIDTFTKDSVCGSTFPSTATVVFDMFLATSVDVSLLVVSRFIVTLASGRVFVIDTFAAKEAAETFTVANVVIDSSVVIDSFTLASVVIDLFTVASVVIDLFTVVEN